MTCAEGAPRRAGGPKLNKCGKVAREGDVAGHKRQQRKGQRTPIEVAIGCTEETYMKGGGGCT